MTNFNLDDLANELAEFEVDEKKSGRSPLEERVTAGFEEIQRFIDKEKRLPEHGESKDIFERIYAVRLDRIRTVKEYRKIVTPIDYQGLMEGEFTPIRNQTEDLDDELLASELCELDNNDDITNLRFVRSIATKKQSEEMANRQKCDDFKKFRPLFDEVAKDLKNGNRNSIIIRTDSGFLKTDIKAGEFFVVFGQTLYIAEVGKKIRAPNGEMDARLRVIYSNGTESNILLRSLQRAFYKDESSRRISEASLGPLFDSKVEEADLSSGTIYVLRSKSNHPTVSKYRQVLHKIGVTGTDVHRRIANARLEPTFLMADVEIVATYELFNINKHRLENLIHTVFERARLAIEIKDRFGNPVTPREWFLVPINVVDEAIERIKSGAISEYIYDPERASLILSSKP